VPAIFVVVVVVVVVLLLLLTYLVAGLFGLVLDELLQKEQHRFARPLAADAVRGARQWL
jgi:hypothetical protein